MAAITIPMEDRKILARFSEFDAKDIELISSVFQGDSIVFTFDILIKRLPKETNLRGLNPEDLMRVLISTGLSFDKMFESSNDLAVALAEELVKDQSLDTSASDVFVSNLSSILNSSHNLRIASKVVRIYVSHQNPFKSVKVFTDIRPIFSDDEQMSVEYGLIYHNLELTYLQGGKIDGKFYIALDSADLKNVYHAIGRALKKEASLKKAIKPYKIYSVDG